MLTSSGDHRPAARTAGVEHMLTKPVRRARLLEAVAEAAGERGSEPVAAVPAQAPPAAVGAHVLVAEDNAINRLVIEGMLAARGISVDVASNGREALDLLARGAYVGVFMDCQMPELDGYGATAAIRAGEQRTGDAHLPVIAMTAHAMAGDRERCLAAGMDDYLSKPLRPDELDRVVAEWITPSAPAEAAAGGAPSESAAFEGLIDEARVTLFRDEYADVAGRLADLFAETTPELLVTLRDAHAGGDAEALGRAAHKLKGSCQNVGASFMATLADAIERGDAPAGVMDELEAAFEPTRDALNDALGGAP
jgi:CheY-like chemotaxis protein/HPt (histidine-containing phosphotransfer) domain-containing protein